MPRPKRLRAVAVYPRVAAFSPEGLPPSGELVLSVEGLEALRLSDVEGYNQEAAAEAMGVSRQTYGRILAEARNFAATAIVTGQRLVVSGGAYQMRGRHGHGHGHGGGRRRGRRF